MPEKFTYVAIILSLQNIKRTFGVIKNAGEFLEKGGRIIIVLNHPAFRIPKHSDWEMDKVKRVQCRKVDN